MMWASAGGHVLVVELLLAKGASIDAKSVAGQAQRAAVALADCLS